MGAVRALEKVRFAVVREGAKNIVMSKGGVFLTIPRHNIRHGLPPTGSPIIMEALPAERVEGAHKHLVLYGRPQRKKGQAESPTPLF
jgi:hypothetical protein